MKYVQTVLPMSRDGTENTRAPARSDCQAIGYERNRRIEYLITGSHGGQSEESGELLCQVFVEKEEQAEYVMSENRHDFIPGYLYRTQLQLYMNKNGDAYRSWKGKLKGRPVCNFYTGKVYKYVHPNSEKLKKS